MTTAPLRVGCYLARTHGLSGLRALLENPRYAVAYVLTHRRTAAYEGAERVDRPDFATYEALTAEHGVPLHVVDRVATRDALPETLAPYRVDLLACISWRMLIAPAELALPRLGGVNLHRGRLPDYAGAFPLHQALRQGDARVEISAHVLTEAIDAGEVLARAEHPVGDRHGEDDDATVDRLKDEITPLFGPLLIQALDALAQGPPRSSR